MAYCHIAHDCIVGDNVIMANMATLGGHVELGDWAFIGGGVLVHQFCKVGEHALIAAGFRAVQDVPPFIWASGEPIKYSGINSVGLKRRGFLSEERRLMKQVYALYFRSKLSRTKALNEIKKQFLNNPVGNVIVDFIEKSNRGII